MDVKQIFGGHYKRLVAEGIVKSAVWALVVCLSVNAIFAALYWMLGVGAVWLGAAVGIPLGAILGVLLYIFKYKPTEKAVAARISVASEKAFPIRLIPIGSPFLSYPQGVEMAGRPAIFARTVQISSKYIWAGCFSILPILYAVVGAVGVKIKSQVLNISSN